jgi:hypothetical protein
MTVITRLLSACTGGVEKFQSFANVKNRVRSAMYAEAELNTVYAGLKGARLEDVLLQPFRSDKEFLRALLRLLSSDTIFTVMAMPHKYILPMPGDFPCFANTWKMVLQAKQTVQEPRRGPHHLGDLLRESCEPDEGRPETAAPELWQRLKDVAGEDDDNVLKGIVGEMGSRVCPIIDSLHQFLNAVTDLYEHHGDTFIRPFYEYYMGKPMRAKPRVREIVVVLEGFMSAWWDLREEVLALFDDLAFHTQESRFDVTLVIDFFEERLVRSVAAYNILLRESIPDAAGGTCGDRNPWVWSVMKDCLLKFTTQRKNYHMALFAWLDHINFWRKTDHSLGTFLEATGPWVNSEQGESYLHVIMRLANFAKSSIEAREEVLRHMFRRSGLDYDYAALQNLAQNRDTHTAKVTEPKLTKLRECAGTWLTGLVTRVVTAAKADWPVRMPKNGGSWRTDLYTMPAVFENEQIIEHGEAVDKWVYGYRCGATAFALFNEGDETQRFTPEYAKRNEIGCQMPSCSGCDTTRVLPAHSCGHWRCSTCRATACELCYAPLYARMMHVASWYRGKIDCLYIDPSTLHMTKLFTPPKIEGTGGHISGEYWLSGGEYDDAVVGAGAPAMDVGAADQGSDDDADDGDGDGDGVDVAQKPGDDGYDGVDGDTSDDDILEVDPDDDEQVGHGHHPTTVFQYSAERNIEFLKTLKPGQRLAAESDACRICKAKSSFSEARACELRHRRVGEGEKLHPVNCMCAQDEVMGGHLSDSEGYRCKQEAIYACPRPACRCKGYTVTFYEAAKCLASHKVNTDAVPAVHCEDAAQAATTYFAGGLSEEEFTEVMKTTTLAPLVHGKMRAELANGRIIWHWFTTGWERGVLTKKDGRSSWLVDFEQSKQVNFICDLRAKMYGTEGMNVWVVEAAASSQGEPGSAPT